MRQLIVFMSLLLLPLHGFAATTREAQWKKVDEAAAKGLPQTAIQELEPIISDALNDKAYAEATKAIGRKIAFEGTIQGNKPEEKIIRLQAELARAPKEIVPMLETILAEWFWQYFQQNRWRFMQRTSTAEPVGTNFTTWDLPRLFREINKHFTAALSSADVLKQTPVAAWDDLLEKGTVPDSYRPTLYDFIAHEALDFYQSAEQAGAQPEDSFDIGADSPIFGSTGEFLAWTLPQQADGDRSPSLSAILLFQELLRFHRDTNSPAFAAADLDRLAFGINKAFGETKSQRYKAALSAYVTRWADHEISAQALRRWAESLRSEGDFAKAHELAERGSTLFPESIGGKQCLNLLRQIEQRTADISTERVWNAPWPKITVKYRNVTDVYFRAVSWNWDEFLDRKRSRPENLNSAERKQLLARAATVEWSAKLPATTDFKERAEVIEAPRLKPGFYFLIASHDRDFTDRDNQVSFTTVWVSDLALVVRTHYREIQGFVLWAESGEPISGAEVNAWRLDPGGNRVAVAPVKTDENGYFAFTNAERGYLLRARFQGHDLGAMQDFYPPGGEPLPQPSSQTIFFTDRALYRPGQTIQYKGICLRADTATSNTNSYTTLGGKEVSVVFRDPNGKEIARQTHRCNAYGSFSGSFTAPRDRVAGGMLILAEGDAPGSTQVSVEEYKRPKFQVTIDTPKQAAKLNEKVSVTARAESYTGAAVDDAEVRWRVVRQVRWPIWWGWISWRQPVGTEQQEIAHGTSRTGTDGTFNIEFVARPEVSIAKTNEPIFVYAVHADVVDSAGETRSADRDVRAGYTALQAALTADDWQVSDKPVELKLKTTSLDDEPQSAEGTLRIYRLQQPAIVQRPALADFVPYGRGRGAVDPGDESTTWPLGEQILEKGFVTDAQGAFATSIDLPAGPYRALVETQDRFGAKVTALLPVRVLNPSDTKFAIRIPSLVAAPKWSIEPGHEFMALWGSGYDTARAFVEIEHRHKMIERFWTKSGQTQQQIKRAVDESMRGGFTLHVTQVRENRAYLESHNVEVPWSNKDLEIKWEHFTSKLMPAQKETWTAVISGSNAPHAVAEMVAALYDASLDAYLPHSWTERFNVFHDDRSSISAQFENRLMHWQHLLGGWDTRYVPVELRYRSLPGDIRGFGMFAQNYMRGARMAFGMAPAPAAMAPMADSAGLAGLQVMSAAKVPAESRSIEGRPQDKSVSVGGASPSPKPDLSQVAARKNLNETAFFFPQLLSDSNGVVRLQFTMPEALTKWQFFGFAHDKALRSGFLKAEAVTSKDLMVQPNPPRFLREGDVLEFTVKISNQSAARQSGSAKLSFAEAATGSSADQALGNKSLEQPFDIPAKESRTLSWRISVPDALGFLSYKAVASTGRISDGEEGYLPVLSRRVFITESLPLPIRGPGTRRFDFARLKKSGQSETLRNQSLTVQMVSNPSWYAVLALPYLMEFPHECSEQVFNRFYANALARHIAGSDPKIHRIFEQWRNTPALESPLEKNQDLKSVALEETPWLRQAHAESQARRNVGILFDDNRLESETAHVLQKLSEMQLEDGAWPWFPGGRGNDYITLYIVTGFGRLRHLGVDVPTDSAVRALGRLDTWMDARYREILKSGNKAENHLSPTIALYLYGRSFFLKDAPIKAAHTEAMEYFRDQAVKHWLALGSRQSQGHLALALTRFGDKPAAQGIMRSLKERSVTDDELGRFWRDTELSWWWYRAPIETQALMIEAFDEVTGDAATVEECKTWLIKQKQTQDWKTTKATADAVYALMLRGGNWLASDALVEVELGGEAIKPGRGGATAPRGTTPAPVVEPGTGFYEVRFQPADIKPTLGDIVLKKRDEGIAWGSIHWQYLEDISKVEPYAGTPLKLAKSLFTKSNTARGPVLERVRGPVKVGDELVVRIELRVDRDMEYIHMKDQRGSGTEPVNVLSRYKYQDGLAYYESTRDTATHFFIDYLPKGVYVFEYSTRVQHRGEYQSGVTEIQCMYAPEFNSHSESVAVVAK